MVASSDLYTGRSLDLFIGAIGHVLAGRVPMAAPTSGSPRNGIHLFGALAGAAGSGLPDTLAAALKRGEPAALGAGTKPDLLRRRPRIFCNIVGGL